MNVFKPIFFLFFCLYVNAIFSQPTFTEHSVAGEDGASSIFAIDLDSDGDIDILSASENLNKISWHKNNGSESFTSYEIGVGTGARSVFAIDLDKDGDIDVLGAFKNSNKIAWFENNGSESFTEHYIAYESGANCVFAIDLDQDGDVDVLSTGENSSHVNWHENNGSEGFTSHFISFNNGAYSVYAVDLDDDGDIDVLSTGINSDQIEWYENNGNEIFTSHNIGGLNGASSVYPIDLDADGDQDVLATGFYADKVNWYENNGSEVFTSHNLGGLNGATSVYSIDLDGDNDLDVMAAGEVGDQFRWYENNGSNSFTDHLLNGSNGARSIMAIDVDGDFDYDIVTAAYLLDRVAWYEQAGSPSIPSTSTRQISSITKTSAVSGGSISDDGDRNILSKGIVWNRVGNPTIESNDGITNDGTGTTSYYSDLTGLTPGTTYYVRSYATNAIGTGYGNQLQFTTTQIYPPFVSTTSITSVTKNSAVSGGTISSDGGDPVVTKGIVWNTTGTPTIDSNDGITNNGNGTSGYTSNLTNLLPGTTYYVRAYATNSSGTGYGNVIQFSTTQIFSPTISTTSVTSVTKNSAVSGGTISSDGGDPVVSKGVVWNTTGTPTISSYDGITNDGNGTSGFSSNLTSLSPGTNYYVRAFATNSAGTGYGNQIQFSTTEIFAPTVTTNPITSITNNSAVSGGDVSSDGNENVLVKGIVWSTTESPSLNEYTGVTNDGTGTGSYSSSLTGLIPGTIYYVKAYATNNVGTSYGEQIQFATNSPPLANDTSFTIYYTLSDLKFEVSKPGILFNDYDADDDDLTVGNPKPDQDVSKGILSLNADGSFFYTPNSNVKDETDFFTYYAFDGKVNSDEVATVTLNIVTPIFTGNGVNNNFSNPENWNAGYVPVDSLDIIISAGKHVDIDINCLCASIQFMEGASFKCINNKTLIITDDILDKNGKAAIKVTSSLIINSSIKIQN